MKKFIPNPICFVKGHKEYMKHIYSKDGYKFESVCACQRCGLTTLGDDWERWKITLKP